MILFQAITDDIPLESLRAVVVTGLFIYVYITGRRTQQSKLRGWNTILAGFGLLLFASILDVTDNFDQLNRFVVIGDTHIEALLEKLVGYLGGYILLFIGFLRWLPLVSEGTQSRERRDFEEVQQRYRDLVDLSPDAIILHRKGKIIYANAAAATLIGSRSPAALTNKNTLDFIHPDYHQQTLDRLQALGKTSSRKLPLVEIKIVSFKGDVLDVEVASGVTNFHGEQVFQSVLRDITARVRAKEALRESERELRSIFDNMAEFYYRADLDGKIVRASGAALDVTGWNSNEIIGLKLAERYVDPEGREKFLRAMQDNDGVLRNFEAQLVHRDGRRIWVSTNARYYRDASGAIAGIEGTTRDITETVQARDVLQHMAMHDVLTGLGNRRSFEARLKEALPRARRAGSIGAILYFDLDGFKAINDGYGHDMGDSVLRAVSQRIKTLARETDYVARIGGDEFCLVIEDGADTSAFERVAEKLIESLSAPYLISDHELTLGVSIGIVPFDGREKSPSAHALLTVADQAMYEAKNSGGNAYRFAPAQGEKNAHTQTVA